MLYAVALTLCTAVESPKTTEQPNEQCGTYVIATDDAWHTKAPCMSAMVVEADKLADVWKADGKLKRYLDQYRIVVPLGLLTSYDFTCEGIPDNQIP